MSTEPATPPAASDLERAQAFANNERMPGHSKSHPFVMALARELATARAEGESAEHDRCEQALAIVGELQRLVINVCGWVATGYSETAATAMRDAMNDGWAKIGWKAFCAAHNPTRKRE